MVFVQGLTLAGFFHALLRECGSMYLIDLCLSFWQRLIDHLFSIGKRCLSTEYCIPTIRARTILSSSLVRQPLPVYM
jgi:hypothetical protein